MFPRNKSRFYLHSYKYCNLLIYCFLSVQMGIYYGLLYLQCCILTVYRFFICISLIINIVSNSKHIFTKKSLILYGFQSTSLFLLIDIFGSCFLVFQGLSFPKILNSMPVLSIIFQNYHVLLIAIIPLIHF